MSHSEEAEYCCVGCVLLDPSRLDEVLGIIRVDDLSLSRPRTLLQAAIDLTMQRTPVDSVTMFDLLQSTGRINAAGGPEGIARAFEIVPTAVNAVHYAEIVRAHALKRKAVGVIHEAKTRIEGCDPRDIAAEVALLQSSTYDLTDTGRGSDLVHVKEGLRGFYVEAEARFRSGAIGMSTGYPDIDKLLLLQRKQMTVLAARPSMGKSSLAKGLALNLARGGHGVAVFPLEDQRDRFILRCVSELSGVPASLIKAGRLQDQDWEAMQTASDLIWQWPLFIDDPAELSVAQVTSKVRRLKIHADIRVVVIDYLGLMNPPTHYANNQERELADISKAVKRMAKELDLHVILVAQLNRECEKRANRRPVMSDLRGSGSIEQDADIVMFIYRDDYYNQDSKDKGIAEVLIAKARDAATGMIRLRWDPSCVRFLSEHKGGEDGR